MKRPEARYFCNKCGYVGPNSQHENCSYFACTSLEYQYIEELERQLAEAKAENRDACMGLHDYYAPKVALLREALYELTEKRCSLSPVGKVIVKQALAATEDKGHDT